MVSALTLHLHTCTITFIEARHKSHFLIKLFLTFREHNYNFYAPTSLSLIINVPLIPKDTGAPDNNVTLPARYNKIRFIR